VFEQFTETFANAVFQNNGTADILINQYTVTIVGSDLPQRTVNTAVLLPGGRCSDSPTTHCGLDNDCGFGGECVQTAVPVGVLLVNFVDKTLLVGDAQCPGVDPFTGLPTPGTVVPRRYQINVVFKGSDETGEGFTINAPLDGNFFDANNCNASSED
jgi:hypothetical protein